MDYKFSDNLKSLKPSAIGNIKIHLRAGLYLVAAGNPSEKRFRLRN